MQIHSLPRGGALGANIAASPVMAVDKAAPRSYTLLYQAFYRQDEMKMPTTRFWEQTVPFRDTFT